MKLQANLYHIMMVTALTGCGGDSVQIPGAAFGRPVGMESDALLRTLAGLAREGVPALCNKEYLEKKLDVKIDVPRTTISEKAHVTLAEVSSASSEANFSTGRYGTFSNAIANECYLSVETKSIFLCNADSTHVRQIFHEETEYAVAIGGRSAAGIFYTFRPTSGGMSKVFLGTTDEKCIYGFSMFAEALTK